MRKKTVVAALVAVAIALGVALGSAMIRPRGPDAGEFHGARLGMTANAVRDRFVAPSAGVWKALPSTSGGDVVLSWWAAGPEAPDTVSFEFHNGILVAVRALIDAKDAEAKRPALAVSSGVVRTNAGEPPAAAHMVRVTILARDCPTHAAEAARLAAGGR